MYFLKIMFKYETAIIINEILHNIAKHYIKMYSGNYLSRKDNYNDNIYIIHIK